MTTDPGSEARFDYPPALEVLEPAGLSEAVVEVTKQREMRLAELRSFVADMEREEGPVDEELLQAVRQEWLG